MGERGTTRRMCLLQTGLLLSLHSAVILLADPHLSPRYSVRRCLLKIHGAARVTRARRTGAGEDVCGFWPRLSAGRVSVTGQACQQRQIVAVATARAPLRVNQRLVRSVVSSSSFSFIFLPLRSRLKTNAHPCFVDHCLETIGANADDTSKARANQLPGWLRDVCRKASGGVKS